MRRLNVWGQPEKFRDALERAGVRHGQTVEATLHGVAVDPVGSRGRVHARFCPMAGIANAITNIKVVDDIALPGPIDGPVNIAGEQTLKGNADWVVSIQQVRIVSNGSLHVDLTHGVARRTAPILRPAALVFAAASE